MKILINLLGALFLNGIFQGHTHAELEEKIKPIFRIAELAFGYLFTPPAPKGIKVIPLPEENPFFEDVRMIGKQAGNILEWLIREPTLVDSYENSNMLIGTVFKRVKKKIGHCYAEEDKYLMKQALMGDYDYEGPHQSWDIERSPNSKEFPVWFFKLLESKVFLRIICGIINVEWDLLGNAFFSKLHYIKE